MAVDMEALASGMNEEIKRQSVVLEAYVKRIAELEAALRDAYPFVCISIDQWRRNNMEAKLHPTHAEMADRIARLIGNERMPSEMFVK